MCRGVGRLDVCMYFRKYLEMRKYGKQYLLVFLVIVENRTFWFFEFF